MLGSSKELGPGLTIIPPVSSHPEHHPQCWWTRRTLHPSPLPPAPQTDAGPAQWKVLVVDETSRKLINGAVKEEEILNLNVSSEPV